MQKTKPGIWFEANRNRYRVRLYKGKKVNHLSYHATYAQALAAYNKVKALPNKAGTLNTLCQQLDVHFNKRTK
jgi:hypothetical protein